MKYKSDLKVKYGVNIIDEIENKLAVEISNSINRSILNDVFNLIPEGKKYLLSLIDINLDKENQLSILMEKYSITEEDLNSIEIVKLKIRDYNINEILKK